MIKSSQKGSALLYTLLFIVFLLFVTVASLSLNKKEALVSHPKAQTANVHCTDCSYYPFKERYCDDKLEKERTTTSKVCASNPEGCFTATVSTRRIGYTGRCADRIACQVQPERGCPDGYRCTGPSVELRNLGITGLICTDPN